MLYLWLVFLSLCLSLPLSLTLSLTLSLSLSLCAYTYATAVRQFLTTTVSAKNEDEMLPTFAPPVSNERRTAVDSIIGSDTIDNDGSEVSDDAEDPSVGLTPSATVKSDKADKKPTASDSKSASPAAAPARLHVSTPALPPGSPRAARAVALFDYDGTEERSLAIVTGDALLVKVREPGADWCYCKRVSDGREGWVPVCYIHDENHDE